MTCQRPRQKCTCRCGRIVRRTLAISGKTSDSTVAVLEDLVQELAGNISPVRLVDSWISGSPEIQIGAKTPERSGTANHTQSSPCIALGEDHFSRGSEATHGQERRAGYRRARIRSLRGRNSCARREADAGKNEAGTIPALKKAEPDNEATSKERKEQTFKRTNFQPLTSQDAASS